MPKQQKKSSPARSRNGRAKRSASGTKSRPAKRKRPARRAQLFPGVGGPTPLVKIVSVMGGGPPPSVLTVNAACRMAAGMACGAWLMNNAGAAGDIGPATGPGVNPNNPQFTFNLNAAGQTYALEVFVVDPMTGEVLVSDSQLVAT